MSKVLITGGTGLIGSRLSGLLKAKGYEVIILTRNNNFKNSHDSFHWNIQEYSIDDSAFKNIDHILHLAGAGVADKRWSKKRKKEILTSRVVSTNLLYDTIKRLKIPLKSFVAASAIGYYGSTTTDKIFIETDQPHNDFLGNVCKLWERAIHQFENLKIRTVALRTGIVLSKDGGALEKMKTPIITPIGNGKQYMPWIHIDDLCNLYINALEDNQYKGVYNAVSPEHITNYSFSKTLSYIFNKPFLSLTIPKFVFKLVFGEMSKIILNGSRISSRKLSQTGFEFKYEKLNNALKNLR